MTAVLLALFFIGPSAGSNLHSYEAVEPHMGTLFRIKLYAASEAQAQQAFHSAFARIDELDRTLSDYQPASELNRLTQIAVNRPVRVSDDLYTILDASENLSEKTEGAFDITIGPLTHLWRDSRKRNELPDPKSITAARAKCGYRKLHLDKQQHSALLDESGMQLDAGGIAKGYAADQALTVLTRSGISSALVAASGDLAFSNPPPNESAWKIGIDSLDSANAPFTRIVLLSNAAVSTSGPTEQHLDTSGVRYSHIIDPETGMGLTRDIAVTVIAPRGTDADSFSTAVSVLGVQRGLAFIERQRNTSTVILTKQDGRPHLVQSSNFAKLQASP
jgi:FAD:protein FMN transferase